MSQNPLTNDHTNRIAFLYANLIGNGKKYEGLLRGVKYVHKKGGGGGFWTTFALEKAVEIEDDFHSEKELVVIEKLTVRFGEIISINAENVRFGKIRNSQRQREFMIDGEYGKKNKGEKDLVKWETSASASASGEKKPVVVGLEEEEGEFRQGSWDQYEGNKIVSDFHEDEYSEPVDWTIVSKEELNDAERLASEIQNDQEDLENVHVAIERNVDSAKNLKVNEEELYSSVPRTNPEEEVKKPKRRLGLKIGVGKGTSSRKMFVSTRRRENSLHAGQLLRGIGFSKDRGRNRANSVSNLKRLSHARNYVELRRSILFQGLGTKLRKRKMSLKKNSPNASPISSPAESPNQSPRGSPVREGYIPGQHLVLKRSRSFCHRVLGLNVDPGTPKVSMDVKKQYSEFLLHNRDITKKEKDDFLNDLKKFRDFLNEKNIGNGKGKSVCKRTKVAKKEVVVGKENIPKKEKVAKEGKPKKNFALNVNAPVFIPKYMKKQERVPPPQQQPIGNMYFQPQQQIPYNNHHESRFPQNGGNVSPVLGHEGQNFSGSRPEFGMSDLVLKGGIRQKYRTTAMKNLRMGTSEESTTVWGTNLEVNSLKGTYPPVKNKGRGSGRSSPEKYAGSGGGGRNNFGYNNIQQKGNMGQVIPNQMVNQNNFYEGYNPNVLPMHGNPQIPHHQMNKMPPQIQQVPPQMQPPMPQPIPQFNYIYNAIPQGFNPNMHFVAQMPPHPNQQVIPQGIPNQTYFQQPGMNGVYYQNQHQQ